MASLAASSRSGQRLSAFTEEFWKTNLSVPFLHRRHGTPSRWAEYVYFHAARPKSGLYRERDRCRACSARAKGLTDKHFDAFLKHFRVALDEVGVKPDKAERVMKLLETKRGSVLNR